MCLRFLPSTSNEVLTTSYEARAGPHIGWIADLGAVWPFIYTPRSAARSLGAAVARQGLEPRHDRCRRRHLEDRGLLLAGDVHESPVGQQRSGGVADRGRRELRWQKLQTRPD